MVKIVSIFSLVFLFCGCYAQHTKQSVMQHKYEILFNSVGSPQDVRYSISINKGSIQAKKHRSTKCNKKTDDEKVYDDDDFSFESPPKDIVELLKYLVEVGVIKIELYGFS